MNGGNPSSPSLKRPHRDAADLQSSFIAAASWKGSKPGYYFGTSSRGTGYYHDIEGQQQTDQQEVQQPPKKRSVRIDEDQNTTLLIQAEQNASSNQRLLLLDLSPNGIHQATTALSKAVSKNELARAEYSSQPDQYMESELALYETITMFKSIAADPKLYTTIVSTAQQHTTSTTTCDLTTTLTILLLHENTDIVCSAISVFLEWMDVSLLESEAPAAVVALASHVLQSHETLEALMGNLERLKTTNAIDNGDNENENDDEVGKGTEDILSLFENLLEMDLAMFEYDDMQLIPNGSSVAAYLCQQTTLVAWLLQQVESKSINQQLRNRALELLALIAPREDVHEVLTDWSKIPIYTSNLIEADDPKESCNSKRQHLDGIDILLQQVAVYRKKQPNDDLQVEMLENAGLILASALTFGTPLNVEAFLNLQGTELVVRCLRERVHAGGVGLMWLDFTGSDAINSRACEHLVDAGALKYLFPIFMGKSLPKPGPHITTKKQKKAWNTLLETNSIRILYDLTRHLRDDSRNDAKARLLAKFINDEKCDRLVELCIAYDQAARLAEYKFYRSDIEEELGNDNEAVQLAALNAKLEGGGDMFHRLGAIICFVCAGSKRCHKRILSQLQLHNAGMGLIQDAVKEFISVLGDTTQKDKLQKYLDEIL
jgi:beta-catenin-like protein 1